MALFDAVFEGGGAKGVAFAGALEVLAAEGHELRRVLGTSAGAITAAFCAAGYSPKEMMDAVCERLPDGKPRFSSFMDIPPPDCFNEAIRKNSVTMKMFERVDLPFVPSAMEGRLDEFLLNAALRDRVYARMFSFIECGGFYAGDVFRQWLVEKLAVKGIGADDTLATMFAKTGKDLSLVVSDVGDMEMLILNHRTAPDVPVAWAVRMSMSIPFVWQEVVWRKEWGRYRNDDKTGNIMVDGGLLSNFPIRFLATLDHEVGAIMGNTDPLGAGNLGLMIDETLPVPGAPDNCKTPTRFTSVRTIQRVSRLLDTMRGASDNEMIRRFQNEICRLPAKNYGTLEFDMEGARLDVFVNAAREAMRKHLVKPGAVTAAAEGRP